jgi:hypothetical protein
VCPHKLLEVIHNGVLVAPYVIEIIIYRDVRNLLIQALENIQLKQRK